MSSNPALISSKSTINAPQPNSFNHSQPIPSSVNAESGQKRAGSSGSFGSGASTRSNPQARNNQPLRKRHKVQRRARLVDDDSIAESIAMKSINSRKGQTSITHLMNFSLPPRPHLHQQQSRPNGRIQRHNRTWNLGSGYHAADKARYVHANYRFIVRPDRDYHAQTVDADVHVSWDAVLQVLASAETQLTSCPICLSTPVAPRMAKCGHIFCLPCLIRYMHSTDDSNPVPEKKARWKKCPICEDSIYISETRPVRWFVGQEANILHEGGDVLLKLLRREPATILALPRDTAESLGQQDDIPWLNVAEMIDYARFMKGGEEYMLSQYDEEISELQLQEKQDELMFGDDTTWFRKAVAAIGEARQKISGIGNPPDYHPLHGRPRRDSVLFSKSSDVPEFSIQKETTSRQSTSRPAHEAIRPSSNYKAMPSPQHPETRDSDTRDLDGHLSALAIETKESLLSKGPESTNGRPRDQPFFFYHALPNFFLSPLDIRILKNAFGDFSEFPSTILPRVEHISTGHVIDDDLRKRAKYMAHLPYGCEVSFLECDWTDVITPSILSHFEADLNRRRRRNDEKAAREERERLRAEKEEDDKRWAAARRKKPSLIAKSFSETDFQPLSEIHGDLATSPSDTGPISSTPPWGDSRAHSNFATLASPGTSPDTMRTVWGTTAIPPSSPILAPLMRPSAVEDDGWLQGWEKDLLSNEDAAAIVDASISGEGSSKGGSLSMPTKRKKNKKITLMSTNARRGA